MKKIFKFIRKIFSFHGKKAKENVLPEVKEITPFPTPSVFPSPTIQKQEGDRYTKPNPSPELKRKRIQQVFYWDARYFPFRWRTKLIRH